jgi:hypothetical protein
MKTKTFYGVEFNVYTDTKIDGDFSLVADYLLVFVLGEKLVTRKKLSLVAN